MTGTSNSPLCSCTAAIKYRKTHTSIFRFALEGTTKYSQATYKHGMKISYPRPSDWKKNETSIVVFTDELKIDEVEQLGVVVGL